MSQGLSLFVKVWQRDIHTCGNFQDATTFAMPSYFCPRFLLRFEKKTIATPFNSAPSTESMCVCEHVCEPTFGPWALCALCGGFSLPRLSSFGFWAVWFRASHGVLYFLFSSSACPACSITGNMCLQTTWLCGMHGPNKGLAGVLGLQRFPHAHDMQANRNVSSCQNPLPAAFLRLRYACTCACTNRERGACQAQWFRLLPVELQQTL